jgi:integrase
MHPQTYLALNKRGYWEIRWPGQRANGAPGGEGFSTKTRDRDLAERIKGEYDKQLAAADVGVFTDPTVTDCLRAYLRADRGAKGPLHRSQHQLLSRFLRSPLAGLRPAALGGKPLRDWRAQRAREAAPSTVQREVGALIAALNWAAHPDKGGMILPADVPKVAMPAIEYPEKRFLDEDMEAEFLRLALGYRPRAKGYTLRRATRLGLFVAIGLNTGARKEAIEEVPWSRIDMKARRIDFRDPGRAINNKRRVLVPINPRLFDVLDRVPVNDRWGPVVGVDMRVAFGGFVRTTPWPWVTSHTMRHTFITLSLRAGVSLFDVSQLVGDTYATLEKHYAHHQADSRLDAAANKRFSP